MSGTLEKLAAIRELQGREAIDGSRIQGFESGAPPPPAWTPPTSTVPPQYINDDPDEDFTISPDPDPTVITREVSPLVAAARPDKPKAEPPPMPQVNLAVIDSNAAYLGYSVTLTEKETAQVVRIVALAIQNKVRSLIPGRQRKAKPADPQPSGEAPVRKRRGRPRGSLLK